MKANKTQTLARRLMADRVSIPEGKSGDVAVEHEHHAKGDPLMLVNFRVAMFSGQKPQDYICPEPTVIHRLSEGGGTWMTDLPCELVQMHDELAKHARGEVLIGGLGLGLLARMVARMPRVTGVTVVEQSQDVANVVWPHLEPQLGGKAALVVEDLNRFPVSKRQFAVALLDTWQGTGEMTWTFDVVPLRRKLARSVSRIHCWQEQTMLGQIGRTIIGAAAVSSDHFTSGACAPQYAFVRALEEIGVKREQVSERGSSAADRLLELGDYERCRVANVSNYTLRYFASLFVHKVGTPAWERMFGKHWDAVARKEAA